MSPLHVVGDDGVEALELVGLRRSEAGRPAQQPLPQLLARQTDVVDRARARDTSMRSTCDPVDDRDTGRAPASEPRHGDGARPRPDWRGDEEEPARGRVGVDSLIRRGPR